MIRRKHMIGIKTLSDSNNQSDEHTETDENGYSSEEAHIDSTFSFLRTAPDEAHMQKKKF